ncbi:hypothetical protein FIV00_02905 [Labrenzia sp. THAF82]|uniref:hypothetical protein n=1 Tax=Labrenzia sp. THAF82 TaxID=2587861 RepID=UPI0012684F83|nr:hypothetical protein [Labrenzia sp. THAF82]QFT29424.1 hypothetical protein FIV00_02905 [Labrenzia sp. THAF82]
MTNYGFGSKKVTVDTLKLPQSSAKPAVPVSNIAGVLQNGQELGFVSREPNTRRKPGPKRTEAQDKITVTGRKHTIDQLKAYCDLEGLSYCEAIERLLGNENR